jgi:phosphate transport system permease protein
MQIKKKINRWPSTVLLILAILPLIFLALIVVNLAINSREAIVNVGLFGYGKLLSPNISGVFSTNLGLYGLLPGIWGTFLVIVVSMAIAVPISMAMAIFASEFTLGFLGKGMRTTLGILGGIPSIIYALMAGVFAQLFIVPKFTGAGLSPIPPPGMWWWKPGSLPFNTSTLLGGIMISMLIIPFMAPLFEDAIRNVPNSLKEASLGLGASRWHTLKTTTLPYALREIISACSLGVLTAMGDVVIAGIVIGFESPLPTPLYDVLKSTAPLTSTGAGFSGGFDQGAFNATANSAANFTGLLLLVMAFAIMGVTYILQRRFKRRVAR